MKSPLNHCSSPVPGLLFPTQEKQQLQEARNRKEVLSSSEPWPWEGGSQGEWDRQGAHTGRGDDFHFAQHWPWSRLNNAPLFTGKHSFFLFKSPYYMKGKAELDLPFGFVLLII